MENYFIIYTYLIMEFITEGSDWTNEAIKDENAGQLNWTRKTKKRKGSSVFSVYRKHHLFDSFVPSKHTHLWATSLPRMALRYHENRHGLLWIKSYWHRPTCCASCESKNTPALKQNRQTVAFSFTNGIWNKQSWSGAFRWICAGADNGWCSSSSHCCLD